MRLIPQGARDDDLCDSELSGRLREKLRIRQLLELFSRGLLLPPSAWSPGFIAVATFRAVNLLSF